MAHPNAYAYTYVYVISAYPVTLCAIESCFVDVSALLWQQKRLMRTHTHMHMTTSAHIIHTNYIEFM